MDMDRIMPVTFWSTLGGGDEVDILEDIDTEEGGGRREVGGGQISITSPHSEGG
jgi:hypothetical protein